jgi:hypothetical protein
MSDAQQSLVAFAAPSYLLLAMALWETDRFPLLTPGVDSLPPLYLTP